jgi:SHS2 domain-containing protein
MKYQLIEHTADIGIQVSAGTIKQLFENSALALFDIITDKKKIKPSFSRTIIVKASNYEELLNEFLNRLLREFSVENNLIRKIVVKKVGKKGVLISLSALIFAEPYNHTRHLIKTEIKAVTFHNLSIKKTKSGYKAQVVFDV